jgi:hypothetical protein
VAAATVVGLLGLAAAAAGAGAAGSANGGASKENQKQGSSYKMYVRKDFGNKIRRGAKHVFVYARMAEVKDDGAEVERPDLTEQIEIFSPDAFMEVGPRPCPAPTWALRCGLIIPRPAGRRRV